MGRERNVKKSRFFMLHPEVNVGKVAHLEDLHGAYVSYVQTCVQTLFDHRRLSLLRREKQAFFPESSVLSSQIEKNARDHAIQIVSGWAASRYTLKIRGTITGLKKGKQLTDAEAKILYTIGKYSLAHPSGDITQVDLDRYWMLLENHGGRKPVVRDSLPMRLSEMTATLEDPKEALSADHWLRVSTLKRYRSVCLPLVGNPYVSSSDQVSKGILARKKDGRWRFEAVETKDWIVPGISSIAPHIGLDVGLNVLAATSSGCLYGTVIKPRFNHLYETVRTVRSNRQRQDLRENSPRLSHLESRLSGLIKTATGDVANRLVRKYPNSIFVIEDLDLSNCRGQKRFAYKALHHSLMTKAIIKVVNPAYTSQECPSCHYVSRGNRKGIQFHCLSCGRKGHADSIGSINLLRRSDDKQISLKTEVSDVKTMLRERYLCNRDSSSGSGILESLPLDPKLTVGRRVKTQAAQLQIEYLGYT